MIEYRKISEFPRGTLYKQLENAYSFDMQCRQNWEKIWREYDTFFYTNLDIADQCGFITVVNGMAAGHISWDPRQNPEYTIIGHNCIIRQYKGQGYGKTQLQEALNRIRKSGAKKAVVTTNEILLPAQKNYESVGFQKIEIKENHEMPFAGKYIEYEYIF